MYKLMILIGPVAETSHFAEGWPEFLHHAEAMPGLKREATIRVQALLFGEQDIRMIHELFFESYDALETAMGSLAGQAAGQVLQRLTQGQMTLLAAEHKEDDLDNIRRYKKLADADAG